MPNEAPIQVKTKLKIFSGLPSLVLYFCVFFILLVFFMLSSNFVPLRGVEVELPRTGGRLLYTSRNYVVTIDKDSRIYFNDAAVSGADELKRQLSESLNARGFQPDKERIIIRCDVHAPLTTVAEILSVAEDIGTVDFINGFIEDYNDPLGRKASWEGYVNIKDFEASRRTETLSANAQWFEDNSPVDPRFKKAKVKGVSAKVINAVCLAGDSYPSTPIGINLPNADWIRKEHGSKSVTIANITHTYDYAARELPNSTLKEFAWDKKEIELAEKWGTVADEIHTDLHECLGHGSGQLLPGVSATAMGEYSSALEETRADLFGLYFSADPKMVELGIMPDPEAYKAEYANYIRNGLMVQFTRVELGKSNTEAHMQNRKLIAEWCYEKGAADNVIEKKVRDGKTYFVVNDYVKLRALFAELLAEIQRIKSEGDYQAGKKLVETYAVNIDPDLHKEVLERYKALNLKPYGGFVNPEITPVVAPDGTVTDYVPVYTDDYLGQMLLYGKKYGIL